MVKKPKPRSPQKSIASKRPAARKFRMITIPTPALEKEIKGYLDGKMEGVEDVDAWLDSLGVP